MYLLAVIFESGVNNFCNLSGYAKINYIACV